MQDMKKHKAINTHTFSLSLSLSHSHTHTHTHTHTVTDMHAHTALPPNILITSQDALTLDNIATMIRYRDKLF